MTCNVTLQKKKKKKKILGEKNILGELLFF